MSHLPELLPSLLSQADTSDDVMACIATAQQLLETAGYTVVECNDTKPWGGYLRLEGKEANEFLNDFFSDLTPEEARLGSPDAELSPKLLIVAPKARLSLQKHARRAERWRFLTAGSYYKSLSDDPGELQHAQADQVVQFAQGELHRLCGNDHGFVLVAEIWQHTDPSHLSDENDIVRLADDYSR